MRLGLCSGWFPPDTSLETAARRTRDLGLDLLCVQVPGPVAVGRREDLRAVGVTVGAVLVAEATGAAAEDGAPFARALETAVAAAGRLRAPRVVVEGGGFGARADRRLASAEGEARARLRRGEVPDAQEVMRIREEAGAAAAERAGRTLHGALRSGVPLAVRNGGRAQDLLGWQETEWLLEDLAVLALFFDPARALRAHRLGQAPEPRAWAERFARRTCGVLVHGLGSDLAGGSHPEDGGADWRGLAEALPRDVPWVLDVAPALAAADVEDALRYVQAEVGR